MSILFEPLKIGRLELKNRFVRSATGDGGADEKGFVTDQQVKLFSDLAEGEVGLIIVGITYVHPTGKGTTPQNSIVTDDYIPGLRRVTDAVHRLGGKIAIQLHHAGRIARFLAPGLVPLGPSYFEGDPYFDGKYKTMTVDQIREIASAFGEGARRAKEAGFDAVQLHGAHGFLLSQFLSPFTNRRQDEWGGSPENRLRFHHALYDAVRKQVGPDFPVLIKIGVEDTFPEGMQLKEGVEAAITMAGWGFDALEISCGVRGLGYEQSEFRQNVDRPDQEAYYRTWCREIKKRVKVPVIMVGGMRSFELMDELVQKGDYCDSISMCRPFIREPKIISRWQSGDQGKAKCISCNLCLEERRKQQPMRCVQEETGG
jgi:2,4-dienoyl-CoA reductase-like NADH-dependent reductase (Old Yellow Enzyme family)